MQGFPSPLYNQYHVIICHCVVSFVNLFSCFPSLFTTCSCLKSSNLRGMGNCNLVPVKVFQLSPNCKFNVAVKIKLFQWLQPYFVVGD